MSTQEIVEVVGELVVDDGETLAQEHGSRALTVAREIQATLAPRLEEHPAYAPLWQQFRAAPHRQAPALAGVLQVILSADAALARRVDDLLAAYRRAKSASQHVDTGGGAYVGGNVSVRGGDFVGRDRLTITGDGNVVADHGRATVVKTEGLSGEELAALFAPVYRRIEARPPDPDVDKQELVETVERIEAEAAKGEDANPQKVERWLRTLGMMAGDIVDVTAACLLSPAAGVATVIRKVAERAQAEAGSEG
jgi:hypothetical protein